MEIKYYLEISVSECNIYYNFGGMVKVIFRDVFLIYLLENILKNKEFI